MRKLFFVLMVMVGLSIVTTNSFAQRVGNFNGGFGGGGRDNFDRGGGIGNFNRGGGVGHSNSNNLRKVMPPFIVDDGSAYIIEYEVEQEGLENAEESSRFGSPSVQTILVNITPSGEKTTLPLDGKILRRPVISEDNKVLAATAHLSDTEQNLLYIVNLPLVEGNEALKVELEEDMVSMPSIFNDNRQIYLIAKDVNLNQDDIENNNLDEVNQDIKSFLYIINFNGTIESRIEI